MDRAEWSTEVLYILMQNELPDDKLVSFNKDRACFHRYVEMQSSSADRDGFPDFAAFLRRLCHEEHKTS